MLGKEVANTGEGKPVTQNFDEYNLIVNGISIEIFDSKGLEVNDYNNIKESIEEKLKIKLNNQINSFFYYDQNIFDFDNIYDNFYSIFYCFSAKNRRIEKEEIDFIKNLIEDLEQPINIVITNSDSLNSEISKEYREKLNEISPDIKIFEICSINKEKRGGSSIKFGKEELLENMFNILKNDILEKFSSKVEKDIKNEIINLLLDVRVELRQMIDRELGFFGVFKIFQQSEDLFNNITIEFDYKLEEIFEKVEKNINKKLNQNLKPVKEYFYKYKDTILDNFLYDRKITTEDFFLNLDFISDDDIEKWMGETEMGRLMKKIENNEGNLFDFLNIGWKIITIGDTFKDLIGSLIYKLKEEVNKQNFRIDIKKSLEEIF